MKIVIYCEGDTEAAVLKDFLKPFILVDNTIKIVNKRGSGNLKRDFTFDIEAQLAQPDVVIFWLIDLLRIPITFPKSIQADLDPVGQQYNYIQQHFAGRIHATMRNRIYICPVIWEIETWLLADSEALNRFFGQKGLNFHSPEDMAEPAKTLQDLSRRFRKREYDKTNDGLALFRRADARRIYDDNCPHFNRFVNQLLEMQGGQPLRPVSSSPSTFDAQIFEEYAGILEQIDQLLDEASEASFKQALLLDEKRKQLEAALKHKS